MNIVMPPIPLPLIQVDNFALNSGGMAFLQSSTTNDDGPSVDPNVLAS